MQHKNLLGIFPSWVAKAVVYQIFPDRFRKSGRVSTQNSLALKRWSSEPSHYGLHGGDLYGVIEALDYLEELGINSIYLNPIFSSAANHRYHTFDYFQVDPILGGNAALDALIQALHRRDMKIILDGVFNHCSRGFWAFHNLLENREASPYKDWFCVHNWSLSPYPEIGQDCGYSCWWNDPALPKFNHQHPPVRDYLISVATFWLEKGIDGWRLDVPDEVPLDFWADFREKVKSVNSEAWIVGEIWGDARQWLQGGYFDGVMNYRIGWSSLCWVAGNRLNKTYLNPLYPIQEIGTNNFIDVLKTTFEWYSREVNICNLNLLDSHDVPRALNTLMGDVAALKISICLLFLQPGTPCIYYGTEVGLSGGKEPACRECFPWEGHWKFDLRSFIRSLADLRKELPEILYWELQWLPLKEDGLLLWFSPGESSSFDGHNAIAIFINRSRRVWMQIDFNFDDYLFLVGQVDLVKMSLGPQSLALFKGNIAKD